MRTGIEIPLATALHLLHVAAPKCLQPEPPPASPEHLQIDNDPAARLNRGQLGVHGFHVQEGIGRARSLWVIVL